MPQPTTPPKGRQRVLPLVIDHLVKHPGETLYKGDIATALGITEEQVQNTMNSLRNRHPLGQDVVVVARGQVWRYIPNSRPQPATTAKRMFEEIGPAKDGSIVIQDESGALYRATEL